jgi:hypothetical protein
MLEMKGQKESRHRILHETHRNGARRTQRAHVIENPDTVKMNFFWRGF